MSPVELALDSKASLGECPRWDEQNQLLYWVDINQGCLHRFNPRTQQNDTLQFEEEIGCFSLATDGGFVIAARSGFYRLSGWHTGRDFICDPEQGLLNNRFNDGRCDGKGRFIAGSLCTGSDTNRANIWSLNSSNNTANRLVQTLTISNGIAFSPRGDKLYYSDSPAQTVYRADYDLATGNIGPSSVFYQFAADEGYPDGASVDSEGNYWVALYAGGAIAKINPKGQLVDKLSVPVLAPTMVTFGGPKLATLFITSTADRPKEELDQYPLSGGIFSIESDTRGLIEPRFQT